MIRTLIFTVIFLSCCLFSGCKTMRPEAQIPFEIVGKYAVANIQINGTGTLRFIIDTGVRNTIITEMHANDSIILQYSESRKMQGLGEGATLNALVSDSNLLQGGKMQFTNKTIFVIQDDIFKLSQQNGTQLNGLLGIDIFENHVVKMDYTRQKLIFYNKQQFFPPKNYHKFPLLIEGKKIYIMLNMPDKNGKMKQMKMFIDTGAQLNAWFQNMKEGLSMPGKTVYGRIGQGFGGEINGYYGMIPAICIGDKCLKNPIVVFPDSATIAEIVKRSDRDGTIGTQFLSRFDAFYDLQDSAIYLKSNYMFNHPNKFNFAGVELMQTNLFIPGYEITHVWPNSPAQNAGLKPGDSLLEIDGINAFTLSLAEVQGKFEKPLRGKLSIRVVRNDRILKFALNLKNPF